MEELRVGIVGTGFIGRVHARSARLAGARLVGVAGSSPASGDRAAADLHAERAFASGDAAVEADPTSTWSASPRPTTSRPARAEQALAAGKHVVCEKPVALDGAGAQRLADAAASAGRVVAVPFVYRFHPTVHEARARVAAGELGRLRLLHGSYQQDWLLSPDDVNWRVDATLGGSTPGLRRHRFALVRPGRVRVPACEVAAAHRLTPRWRCPSGRRWPRPVRSRSVGRSSSWSARRSTPRSVGARHGSRPTPGRWARCSSARSRPGATGCGSSSTARRPRSPSTRRSPSGSGSAGASAR